MLSLIRRRIGTVTAIVFMVSLLAVTSIASSGWSSSQTSSVSLSTLQLNTPSVSVSSAGAATITDASQTDANGNTVTRTFTLQSSSSATGPWSTATTPPNNLVAATIAGAGPGCEVYDPSNNSLYVSDENSNAASVAVINVLTDTLTATISLGGGRLGV